jgi:hypothetical protein
MPATALSESITALEGIPVHVEDPTAYRAALAARCREDFPDLLPAVAAGIELPSGPEDRIANMRLVGATAKGTIYLLLYKDWLNTQDNEIDGFAAYLDRHREQLLRNSRTVHLVAAGLCGIVRGLLPFDFDQITCSDLSWTNMYYGRALLENRPELLPETFRQPRLAFRTDGGHQRFERVEVSVEIKRAPSYGGTRLSFQVSNAFYAGDPRPEDAVMVFNLLPAYDTTWGRSFLIQILRSLRIGQALVLVNWVGADEGAPDEVVKLLEPLGCWAAWVDLAELPYSKGNRISGGGRFYYQNMVLRIERFSAAKDDMPLVGLSSLASKQLEAIKKDLPLKGDFGEVPAGPSERAVLHALTSAGGRAGLHALGRCSAVATEDRFEWAIANLAQSKMIELSVV